MRLLMNVREAAQYARVCRDTIYAACARREIHHIRVSGRRAIRFRREWIDEWLERYTFRAHDSDIANRRTGREHPEVTP